MGIQGISWFLARHGAAVPVVLPGVCAARPAPRRVIIVDGPNWVKAFVEPCAMVPTTEVPFGSAFGGDHGAVALFVERTVQAFAARGVDLHFVFDSGKTPLDEALTGRSHAIVDTVDEVDAKQLSDFFATGSAGKLPFPHLRSGLSALSQDAATLPAVESASGICLIQSDEVGKRLSHMAGSQGLLPLLRDPSRTLRGTVLEALRRAVPGRQLLLPAGDDDIATARLVVKLLADLGAEAVIGVWSNDSDFFAFAALADVRILQPDEDSMLAALGWPSANYLPTTCIALASAPRGDVHHPITFPDESFPLHFSGRTGREVSKALGLAAPRLIVDTAFLGGGCQFGSFGSVAGNLFEAAQWASRELCTCPGQGTFGGFPARCTSCDRPGRVEDHPLFDDMFAPLLRQQSIKVAFRETDGSSPRSAADLDQSDRDRLFAELVDLGDKSPTLAVRVLYARQYYALQLPSQAQIVAAHFRATLDSAPLALRPSSKYDQSVQAARCLGMLPWVALNLLRTRVSRCRLGLEPRDVSASLPGFKINYLGNPSIMCSFTVAAPLRAVALALLVSVRPLLPLPSGTSYLPPRIANCRRQSSAEREYLTCSPGDGSLLITRLKAVLPPGLLEAARDAMGLAAHVPKDADAHDGGRDTEPSTEALFVHALALHVPGLPVTLRRTALRWAADLAGKASPRRWSQGGYRGRWFARSERVDATAAGDVVEPDGRIMPLTAEQLTVMSLRHILGVSSHCIAAGLACANLSERTPARWKDAQVALQRVPSLPEIMCLLAQAALLQTSESTLSSLLADPQSFVLPARPLLRAAAAATWFLEAATGMLDVATLLGLAASQEQCGPEVRRNGTECSLVEALRCLCQGDTSLLPPALAACIDSDQRSVTPPVMPPPPPQWGKLYEGRLFHALTQTLGGDGVSALPDATIHLLDAVQTEAVVPDPVVDGVPAIARYAISRPAVDFSASASAVVRDPYVLLPVHASALLHASPVAAEAFRRMSSCLFCSLDVSTMLRDQAAARTVGWAGPLELDTRIDEIFDYEKDNDATKVVSPHKGTAARYRRVVSNPPNCPETLQAPLALLHRLGPATFADRLVEISPPERLPIADNFSNLLWAVARCSFSLVLTETGSGKTV